MSIAVWIAWALSVAGCEDPGIREQAQAAPASATTSDTATVSPEPARAIATTTGSTGSGSLDKDVIQRVIREHNPQVQGCYERELENAPRLAGNLTVRFTISPTGGVTASEVVQSHGPNAALERCVASQMLTWAFPKPIGGMVRASYRFVFKQAEPAPTQAQRAHRTPIQL